MKVLIATLAVLIAAVGATPFGQGRITGGYEAKPADIKCFAALYILSEANNKTCGGCLIADNQIITAASCVSSASEGIITSIQIAVGGTQKYDSTLTVKNVYIHKNYDSTNSSAGNAAVIYLNTPVKVTTSLGPIIPTVSENTTDKYIGQTLIGCGFGYTDNKKTGPKSLTCVNLLVIAPVGCAPTTDAAAAAPVGIICTENINDANACAGDIGGPVFINNTGVLQLIGVISHFPNARYNARCQDGHRVAITLLGAMVTFVANATANQTTTTA